MFARVTRSQGSPDAIDEATRITQEKILPQAESIAGFIGVQTLVNRSSGEELTITFWESEEAMQASEDEANRLRAEAADLTDSQVQSVERYEVTLRVGV